VVAAPDAPRPGHTVEKLDLAPMRRGGMLSPNPLIREGDVLVIPTRYPTVYYVLGDVTKPAFFEINSDEKMTFSRAVSSAGGPTKTAKTSKGLVVRYDANGGRQDLAIDYKAVLAGRQPDVEIRSGDIIFIPGSGAKNVGLALIGQLPQIVQNTADGNITLGKR
jgi:protein involved in polysaccharide export with SLBB domain